MINVRGKNLHPDIERLLEQLQLLLQQTSFTPVQPIQGRSNNGKVITFPAASDSLATGNSYVGQNVASTPNSPVTSVNGETGSVQLNSGEVPESGNLYFTDARARTALTGYLPVIGRTSSASDPTTTDLPTSGDLSIHKNTTTGFIYLAYNDSGAIVKIQLT